MIVEAKAKIETHLEFKIATVKASFEPICLQALPSVESNFRSFSLFSFLGQDPRFCSSSLSIKSLKGDFHQLLPMLALSVVVLIVQLKLIVFIDCLITLATNDRKARQIRLSQTEK